MMRALIEFLFVIVLAMVGRAILSSIFRGVGQASASAFQQTAAEAERRRRASEKSPGDAASAGALHKDPVCGTYVPESTTFRETNAGRVTYFCSAACKQQFDAASDPFAGRKTARR